MSTRRPVGVRPWRIGVIVAAFAALAMLAAGCGTTVAGTPLVVGSDVPAGASTPGSPQPPVPATSGTPLGSELPSISTGATAPVSTQPGTAPPVATAPSASGSGGSAGAPPSWVIDGLRITYYTSGATTGAATKWVEDPDGPWVDPATGKHYRQETSQTGADNSQNSAADGYDQYDIKDVSSAGVVYSSTLYTIDHLNKTLELTNTTAMQVTSAKPTVIWLNSTYLQRALTTPSATAPFIVLQGHTPLARPPIRPSPC